MLLRMFASYGLSLGYDLGDKALEMTKEANLGQSKNPF